MGIFLVGKNLTEFMENGDEFLEKIIAYPNEVIHYDSIMAFTGGYEKIVSEKQSQS